MAEPIRESPFRSRCRHSLHNLSCNDAHSCTFCASSRRAWCDGRCGGLGVGLGGTSGTGGRPAASESTCRSAWTRRPGSLSGAQRDRRRPSGPGRGPPHCVGVAATGHPGSRIARAARMRRDVVLSFYGPSAANLTAPPERFVEPSARWRSGGLPNGRRDPAMAGRSAGRRGAPGPGSPVAQARRRRRPRPAFQPVAASRVSSLRCQPRALETRTERVSHTGPG